MLGQSLEAIDYEEKAAAGDTHRRGVVAEGLVRGVVCDAAVQTDTHVHDEANKQGEA